MKTITYLEMINSQTKKMTKTILFVACILCTLSMLAQSSPNLIEWDFDNDVEGWSGNPNNLTVSWNSDGYLDCEVTGEDPYVFNSTLQSFDTDNINYLQLRVKNGTANAGGVFFAFITNTEFIVIPFTMTANSSEFETVLVDLSTVNGWTNNLTIAGMRVDPNNGGAVGTISFDHIYLMETAGPLSIEKNQFSDNVMVYSDDNSITIKNLPEAADYTLYSIMGQVVQQGAAQRNDANFSVSNLAHGIYVLKAVGKESGKLLTAKLLF